MFGQDIRSIRSQEFFQKIGVLFEFPYLYANLSALDNLRYFASFYPKEQLRDVEEVLEELKAYPTEDVYIIGGDSIYEQFLPWCDVIHVTKIDHAYEADAYFPDIDRMPEWVLTGESEEKTYFDLEFRFCRYERREA